MLDLRGKKSGIAAVEFLITLPVLLLILTVIIEFGNAFLRYNTLSKTVQNAARYSVVDIYGSNDADAIADEASIINMVLYGRKTPQENQTPILGLDPSQIQIDKIEDNGVKYVIITAHYNFLPIINLISLDALSDLQLTSSSVMRVSP